MFFASFYLAAASMAIPQHQPTRVDYLEQLLVREGLSRQEAKDCLKDKRLKEPLKKVEEELLTWNEFEKRLLTKESVERGKTFLQSNADWLRQAQGKFSVPPEVLTALMRVESDLGKNRGQYEVYKFFFQKAVSPGNKQWKWAAINFASLAIYCKGAKLDCLSLEGSRAGALGLIQFLPYNLVKFGIDADADGVVDLDKNPDAILSAARFLNVLGWRKSPTMALSRYYGSPVRYSQAVLKYAAALKPVVVVTASRRSRNKK